MTDDDSKLLEDWLTFTFTNVRRGKVDYAWEFIIPYKQINEWKPRRYCLSCGALWTMHVENRCPECKERNLRTLVCRCREIKTIKKIPVIWYKPDTWKGFVDDVKDVWEYRLKQSDTGLLL